ncbi:hypothetical protein HDU76_004048, partial [Blyttiomyces sp. JEL0837]
MRKNDVDKTNSYKTSELVDLQELILAPQTPFKMLMNLIVPIFAIAASTVFATPIVKRDGNAYSMIVLQSSGYVIDFPTTNGQPAPAYTQLQLEPQNGKTNQYLKFVLTNEYGDDNTFAIVNYQTGYCVDALSFGTGNGAAAAGDKIILWDCNLDANSLTSLTWSINDAAIGKFWSQFKSQKSMVLHFPSFNGASIERNPTKIQTMA